MMTVPSGWPLWASEYRRGERAHLDPAVCRVLARRPSPGMLSDLDACRRQTLHDVTAYMLVTWIVLFLCGFVFGWSAV
jgi:hypothetical protein